MNPTVVVVSTVHDPDDTRIRERLIRCLSPSFQVLYAARLPGPSDDTGLRWMPLAGGRLSRNLGALRVLLRERWDVAVVHDPELIPSAALARVARRRPIVFDVHEDLAAQVTSKTWIPAWGRPLARFLARCLYWLAERTLALTLAEAGYSRLFKREHPVFPNYPHLTFPVSPTERGDGSAVYVGDINEARGLGDAVIAAARAGVPLTLIGRVSPAYLESLSAVAARHGGDVAFLGTLPNPEAMGHVATASVGLSPLRALPNYLYSLPTKTIEYLAMGVPVVATDLPGTRAELSVLDAVAFVPAGDVDAMTDAIERLTDPMVKTEAVVQASAIRQRYRWPEEEVRDYYRSLAGR